MPAVHRPRGLYQAVQRVRERDVDPQPAGPAPSCQAPQAAPPASPALAAVTGLTAERLPCLEWRPLKCPDHLCRLLREALPDLPTQTVPVTALRAGGKVRTPGPGCREGASSPAGQAGLGSLWFVTASWSPLFASLQPPRRLFLWAGSWAQSLPRPTLTLISGRSWLSPLRQVRGHGLSTWHPAPPRGNLQTSAVHCRDLASCEAGAAASLC